MSPTEEVLTLIEQTFESERPAYFTYADVDISDSMSEVAEHERTLRELEPHSVRHEHITEPHDAIRHISVDGYKYFMPGLARLAMQSDSGNYYFYDFLQQLNPRRMSRMSREQKDVLIRFLTVCRSSGAVYKQHYTLLEEKIFKLGD